MSERGDIVVQVVPDNSYSLNNNSHSNNNNTSNNSNHNNINNTNNDTSVLSIRRTSASSALPPLHPYKINNNISIIKDEKEKDVTNNKLYASNANKLDPNILNNALLNVNRLSNTNVSISTVTPLPNFSRNPSYDGNKLHEFTPLPSRSQTPTRSREEITGAASPIERSDVLKLPSSTNGINGAQSISSTDNRGSLTYTAITATQQIQSPQPVASQPTVLPPNARVIEINGIKYVVGKRLGDGSFGVVYSGKNIATSEDVAIKVESASTDDPQLAREYKIYKVLEGVHGVPSARGYATQGGRNIMVMDRLGSSLEDLFEQFGQKFSLKTVLLLFDQMLTNIEGLHNSNYIHRDIKPDNFLVGVMSNRTENQLFLIDFGLSKRYCDPITHEHIPFSDKKRLTGTIRYASLNTHNGLEQSRRDDLESIGFMVVFFLNGKLPWQGLTISDKNLTIDEQNRLKMSRIRNLKDTTPEAICKGLPEVFTWYLNYCRSLKFDQTPDYNLIREEFRKLYREKGFECDFQGNSIPNFEWNKKIYPGYVYSQGRTEKSASNATSGSTAQSDIASSRSGINPAVLSTRQSRTNSSAAARSAQLPTIATQPPLSSVSPTSNNTSPRFEPALVSSSKNVSGTSKTPMVSAESNVVTPPAVRLEQITPEIVRKGSMAELAENTHKAESSCCIVS